jgi:hypothetical protein
MPALQFWLQHWPLVMHDWPSWRSVQQVPPMHS